MTTSSERAMAVPFEVRSGPTGFRCDARFASAGGFAERVHEPQAEPEPASIDPVAEAFAQGYAVGLADARAEAELRAAEDARAHEALSLTLARIDAAQAETLAVKLHETVAALCEAALAPLVLDIDALAARCVQAAALFARDDEGITIHLHPDDLGLVAGGLGGGWTVRADSSLERGALRIESAAGGVEDGPEQWRRAIAEAIGC